MQLLIDWVFSFFLSGIYKKIQSQTHFIKFVIHWHKYMVVISRFCRWFGLHLHSWSPSAAIFYRNEKSIFAAVHSLYKFIFIVPQHAKYFQQPQSSYSYEMTLKMSKFYSGNPRQNIMAKLNFCVNPPSPCLSVVFLLALQLFAAINIENSGLGSAMAISKKMLQSLSGIADGLLP